MQNEVWTILEENESQTVWDKIYADFKFKPQYSKPPIPYDAFVFSLPFDEYDIQESHNWDLAEDTAQDELIISFLIACLGEDDYLYALDWQHTCFRYNPRISLATKANPAFTISLEYPDGYNAYFPRFYPDGDYYFFVARDFSWGYFTHPWLKKFWVFGEKLMNLFREQSADLDLLRVTRGNES
ncbi:MAG: DUF2716 domain-containing protein [Oscillospiraceae bacterium]|jgi:hypothetical protein|nr:DUF2716 domain-containing protein [Oscillospiraceae bacterium]